MATPTVTLLDDHAGGDRRDRAARLHDRGRDHANQKAGPAVGRNAPQPGLQHWAAGALQLAAEALQPV